MQVEKCKTVIRECVKFCEDAEGDKAIPSECYDSDGELPEKHIFCSKCLKGTSEEVAHRSCTHRSYSFAHTWQSGHCAASLIQPDQVLQQAH